MDEEIVNIGGLHIKRIKVGPMDLLDLFKLMQLDYNRTLVMKSLWSGDNKNGRKI